MDNNRFQTIFTNMKREENSRSLANAGKTLLGGHKNLSSASQGNLFQSVDMSNAASKFFDVGESRANTSKRSTI